MTSAEVDHLTTEELNDVELEAPDDPAYDLVVGMAAGRVSPEDAASLLATWRA